MRVGPSGANGEAVPCCGCRDGSAEIQCLECLRGGASHGKDALFCGADCFREHWQQAHNPARQHTQRAATAPQPQPRQLRAPAPPSPAPRLHQPLPRRPSNMSPAMYRMSSEPGLHQAPPRQPLFHAHQPRLVLVDGGLAHHSRHMS